MTCGLRALGDEWPQPLAPARGARRREARSMDPMRDGGRVLRARVAGLFPRCPFKGGRARTQTVNRRARGSRAGASSRDAYEARQLEMAADQATRAEPEVVARRQVSSKSCSSTERCWVHSTRLSSTHDKIANAACHFAFGGGRILICVQCLVCVPGVYRALVNQTAIKPILA